MTERFTLISELGRGGMGVVWKARDEESGQIVALKLLHAAFAVDADYVTRFERELELAKRIHSAHVVEVLGYGARDGAPYLALEYVDGPSLRKLLAGHGPYDWPETKAFLVQIAQGLADAHAAGVVHRDLKPSNVLIGSDGVAKLADFGIAKGFDLTRVTGTSTVLGTPAYLAPEGPLDERSDLYSLGIIAFELLTGAAPFAGSTYQEVIVRHIREVPDLEKLPPEARDMVGWLLAKDPAARPQRASKLLPVLYGVEQAPKAQAPAVRAPAGRSPVAAEPPAEPVSPPPPVGPAKPVPIRRPSSPRERAHPGEARAGFPAEDRQPHASRRKATPLIVGLGGVGLVVCLVAVVLAAGSVPRSASPASTATGVLSVETPTPVTGAFSPTGSMGTARSSHTATLLSDGRVLIVGGYSLSTSAELYDPKTGTFSPTGSMSWYYTYHTATLLSDGRVLISGDGWPAQLYDPKTGTFSPTGSMTTARTYHTATLLSDGLVLISGGNDVSGGSNGYGLGRQRRLAASDLSRGV
ncbi:MAG: protein kinase [Candidatus Limnocylindrales bacterium]